MELAFTTRSLRLLCESKTKANKELGEETAEKFIRRLADLRAAICINDLVAGNPRELNHSSEQQFAINISDDLNIIFCANHNTNPLLKCSKIDWSKVTRIKILKIGEYS